MKKFTLFLLTMVLTIVGSITTFAAEKPVPTFSDINTDGTVNQYLYNVEFGGFLVGANDWGTRASVDVRKGMTVTVKAITTGETTTYQIGAMSPDGAESVWIDGSRDGNDQFTITINEDKTFTIGCTKFPNTFLSWGGDASNTCLNFTATAGTWAAVSEADYQAYQTAYKQYLTAENGMVRVKSDSEFTDATAELDGKTLILVDAETSDKLLYNSGDAHDMAAGALSDLEGSEYIFTKFAKADVTVEGVEGNIYTMQMFNEAGTNFSKWGTQGYVNFQPEGGSIVFSLGLGADGVWGQDAANHALWTVEKEEAGYVIKNVGRGTYFNHSQAVATCTDKAYFKFYAEKELYKAEPTPDPDPDPTPDPEPDPTPDPEPTPVADVTVMTTYVDYDNADAAAGAVTTSYTGYNKIVNGSVTFGNTAWGVDKVTYITVDASKLEGTINTAKLDLKVTVPDRAHAIGIGYNASDVTAETTYNTADLSITTLGETQTVAAVKGSTATSVITFDFLDAIKDDADKKVTLLVYDLSAGGTTIDSVGVKVEAGSNLDAAIAELDAAIKAADDKLATYSCGDGLFQYPETELASLTEAIAAANEAKANAEATEETIAAAKQTLNDAVAAFAPKANAPVEGKAYIIMNNTIEGKNLSVTSDKITVAEDAQVYFTAVEGGYAISNADGEYIFKTTDNNWTLSSTKNLEEAYVITVAAVEGGYTLNGAKGTLGLDYGVKAADNVDETVYANKASNYNGIWTIKVAPEPIDPDLIEIEQTVDADQDLACTKVENDDYTEYTTGANVSVIVKILDIDVKDCDYIVVKFAEACPSGINYAVGAKNDQSNYGITEGATELKIDLSDSKCNIVDDVLSQFTLLTLWNSGKIVKISGIYKHKVAEADAVSSVKASSANNAVKKVMKDGKLVIVKGDKTYNVSGMRF